jgi:hypothetical protein
MGITFDDLLSSGFAIHKEQAQNTLKRYLQRNILFAPVSRKPQQYYATCLKAKVLKSMMSKNYPIEVTGVGCSCYSSDTDPVNRNNNVKINIASVPCFEQVSRQPLEDYILPLLPSAQLYIHRMQFKLHIGAEYYHEIAISTCPRNRGKEHDEIIGSARARYCFYSNGTVMVFTESSNNPFSLQDETDRSRLMAFFGQLRDRLVIFLNDSHERIVPDIMQWEMTQCDINKDIAVGDWLQVTGLKIQLRHLDHLFRIYIKSRGADTVCRIEESLSFNRGNFKGRPSAVETINNIFNPSERLENSVEDINRKLDLLLYSTITNNNSGYKDSSAFPN